MRAEPKDRIMTFRERKKAEEWRLFLGMKNWEFTYDDDEAYSESLLREIAEEYRNFLGMSMAQFYPRIR